VSLTEHFRGLFFIKVTLRDWVARGWQTTAHKPHMACDLFPYSPELRMVLYVQMIGVGGNQKDNIS